MTSTRPVLACLFRGAAFAVALVSSSAAQLPTCAFDGRPGYFPVTLAGLENEVFIASRLNDAGEVAGSIPGADGDPWRIFVWNDGALATRAFPGFVVTAEGLSESGVVVGTRRPLAGGDSEVFLWHSRSDQLDIVRTLFEAFPQGVNDDLVIVGSDNGGTFGFALDSVTPELNVIAFGQVPTVGVGTLGTTAINQAGTAVGAEVVFVPSQGFYVELPYRWTKAGGIEQLAVLEGGFGGQAKDIAANGNVAGYVHDEFFTRSSALWTDGGATLVNLGSPSGYFVSDALALNVHDQVVVVAPNDLFGFTRGFVWEGGAYTDLSCFAPPGLFVTRPLDINNVGEILVQLTNAGGISIVDTILLRPDVPFVSSSEVVRLGLPPNPAALRPGANGGPVIGEVWAPYIDHSAFVPDAVLDVFGLSLSAANVPAPPIGTILCGPNLLVRFRGPGNPFNLPIPDDSSLVGLGLCVSGGSFDASTAFFLTNALDITIGDF